MTSARLYRAVAVLFVVFTLGHTVGFLRFTPPTPEAAVVRDAMTNVSFTVRGSTYSYGNFYRGFGLYISLYLAFSAVLAWILASMSRSAPGPTNAITWTLVIVQAVGFGLSWKYFSLPPALFSIFITILLAAAALIARPESHIANLT